jgi:amino acid transporter
VATVELPEPTLYKIKRVLLGRPLVSERLDAERLPRSIAAGVLSPDCISSSAYGTEEMLSILVPAVGAAAFSLVLPVTFAILAILAAVTLSYREVVTVYTKSGGSYVVTRDNFGPKVAQVAAGALIVDYVLTVAVQITAGADVIGTEFPSLSHGLDPLWISLIVLVVMCYANLRGIREAGRAFAFPTYFYVASLGSVVLLGLIRGFMGRLHPHPLPPASLLVDHRIGHAGPGLLLGASLFVFLKAMANGGSSLTGLEAVSNGVGALRPPVARNARFVLGFIACSLGFLVLGVSLIAHWTHAVPYANGIPTVVSQDVDSVLGQGTLGRAAYYLVLNATALILLTGGNTSFNGFPYLASYVAEDSFLPRWFARRGHRLAYSNGILVLTAIAFVLLVVTRANLSSLIALYAIGVFTGFTLSGVGLSKYHITHKEPGWRHKLVINSSAGVLSALVVMVFAVTKFTEGAWVVVVLMPVLVFFLIRLHHQYEIEAEELEEGAPRLSEVPALRRHTVIVMVGDFDLATLRALRYARTLAPDELHAVHFVVDAQKAAALADEWQHYSLEKFPLELVECPDRRLMRAALEYCANAAADGETQVTVLLPRRFYERFWSRLLHDRTADRIAETVSRLPNVSATIIPFHLGASALADIQAGRARAQPAQEAPRQRRSLPGQVPTAPMPPQMAPGAEDEPLPSVAGAVPIGSVKHRQMVTVVGRVKSVQIQPYSGVPNLECILVDKTGSLPLVFVGRREVAGIGPGAKLVARGRVCEHHGRLSILNPDYEFLAATPQPTGAH